MHSRKWGNSTTNNDSPLVPFNPNTLANSTTIKIYTAPKTIDLDNRNIYSSSSFTKVQLESSFNSDPLPEFLCAKRIQEPLRIIRNYWNKWKNLIYQHNIILELYDIREKSTLKFTLSIFYKWFLFTVRKTALKSLINSVTKQNFILLSRRYFKIWILAIKIRKIRNIQLIALNKIQYRVERFLLKKNYIKWLFYLKQRKEIQRKTVFLLKFNIYLFLKRYFLMWIRRRNWKYQIIELKHIRYTSERNLARNILQKWILFISSRIIASNMERLTLEHFVYKYLFRWRRYTYICISLRKIGHTAYWRAARRAFRKWKFWIVRIVVALQLEQRNSMFLMHSYFLRWTMIHKVHRLEYGSFIASKLR